MAKQKANNLLYENELINLFSADEEGFYVQEFKSLQKTGKKGKTNDSAIIRNEISTYFFEYLESFHIPTFFSKHLDDYRILVKQFEYIPILLHVYNFTTPSLSKRLDLKEGAALHCPIFEVYYKNKDNSKTPINETHNLSIGLLSPDEFKQIQRLASKVNAVLRALCERRNLIVADIELEFGRHNQKIILINEITPVTCRFWNVEESGKINKDYFSYSDDNAYSSFVELRNRLQHKLH